MLSGATHWKVMTLHLSPLPPLLSFLHVMLHLLGPQRLPPVRSQKQAAHKKRKKKKVKVVPSKTAEASRIKSYDYRSWDNFDVVSV